MKKALLSLAAGALIASGLCAGQARADLDRGKAVYISSCADCHGVRGEADGPGAEGMEPPPTNFATGAFKHGDTDEAITRSIRDGIPDTSMPAWKELTDEEVADLIAVIRAFKR